MAVCNFCQQEMMDHIGCTVAVYDDFVNDPKAYPRVPRSTFDGSGRDCHDCGCPADTLHHPGCDSEECPKCGGQSISCDCTGGDEGEDD